MPPLIQASHLSKSYGAQIVFSELTFSVSKKQKIGVIGRNGAGKSTLLKIIAGEEKADNGQLLFSDELNLAYLKQNDDFRAEESSLDYLERYSGAPEWRARKLAAKFQLGDYYLDSKAQNLSGGWRMRLKLTAMFLTEPNLVLLDEPTNYLDLHTLILLENYLDSYKGSALIVSHDREFLKQSCQETLEISRDNAYFFPGRLESYLAFKEERQRSLIRSNESLDQQQKHLQEFVDRFRYKSSKAKQAQAAIKKIDKLEKKRISIEHAAGLARISLPLIEERKGLALRVDKLDIGYEGKVVVNNLDFDCRAGEKLAVLGLNGQGKSTLLKTLAGKLPPINGSFRLASRSSLAFHGAEVIDQLDNRDQVGSYLEKMAGGLVKPEAVLKMAGDFLFRGDDLKKNIGVLSGGEKSRLALAGALLSKPDILILDEPTCHLDFETAEALGLALAAFKGNVIFASHDRTFSSLLADRILEIKDGSGRLLYGDYDEYVDELEKALREKNRQINSSQSDSDEKELKWQERKKRQTEKRRLEKDLENLEKKRNDLIDYFSTNPVNFDPKKSHELKEVQEKITQAEMAWFTIMEEEASEENVLQE
jgi:ATP-binding cassette subfamily F protein 3